METCRVGKDGARGGGIHERLNKAIISLLENFAIVFAGKNGTVWILL